MRRPNFAVIATTLSSASHNLFQAWHKVSKWSQDHWDLLWSKMKNLGISGTVYWFALVASATAAIFLLCVPSTVLALTFLAVPPIAVILMKPVSEKQKAFWVAVSLFLILGVHRGLGKDQQNLRTQQQDMNQSFSSVTNKIEDVADKLGKVATTMENVVHTEQETLSQMTSGLRDVVNTETGGDSFCYLNVFPVMPEKNAVNHAAEMIVTRVGKYPLHGTTMTLDDGVKYSEVSSSAFPQGHIPTSDEIMAMMERATEASTTRQSVPDFATPNRSLGVYRLSGEDHESFSVFFSAVNGQWLERLELRRLGPDRWVKAMWVEAPGNPYYVRIDKDYPRKSNGEPDVPWPRLAKTGAPAWEKPKH